MIQRKTSVGGGRDYFHHHVRFDSMFGEKLLERIGAFEHALRSRVGRAFYQRICRQRDAARNSASSSRPRREPHAGRTRRPARRTKTRSARGVGGRECLCARGHISPEIPRREHNDTHIESPRRAQGRGEPSPFPSRTLALPLPRCTARAPSTRPLPVSCSTVAVCRTTSTPDDSSVLTAAEGQALLAWYTDELLDVCFRPAGPVPVV